MTTCLTKTQKAGYVKKNPQKRLLESSGNNKVCVVPQIIQPRTLSVSSNWNSGRYHVFPYIYITGNDGNNDNKNDDTKQQYY